MTDDEKLAAYAEGLLSSLREHLPAWATSAVTQRIPADHGIDIAAAVSASVERVIEDVRSLLETDIDEQRTSPLAVVRSIVPDLNEILVAGGTALAQRDHETERLQPDDVFALAPVTFSDIHPDVHLPGLSWGAAKAHVHLQRRSAEGMR